MRELGFGEGTESALGAQTHAGGLAGDKQSLSVDQASQLITRGETWSGTLGAPVTVTYAFRATAPTEMPADTTGFQRFNTAQIAQAELSLKAWSDVANIHFVRIGAGSGSDTAYSDAATILFGDYTTGQTGSAAFAWLPTTQSPVGGDVWVNGSLSYNASPTQGNYGAHVLLHEIGHAIGLSHPGVYDASTGEVTYAGSAAYFEDSAEYSVMSYFSETNTGGDFHGGYAAMPMLDDIAALQRDYGANLSTRAGDTVYGFHSNTGQAIYDFAAEPRPILAIWDGGGVDTLDCSGYAMGNLIDLNAGHFSDVGGLLGNVAIAYGCVIENAVGGRGADTILGNEVANLLIGGGGDDVIYGGGGEDTAGYSAALVNYSWTANPDGSWTVRDLRSGAPDGVDMLFQVEDFQFADRTISTAVISAVTTAFANVLRVSGAGGAALVAKNDLIARGSSGLVTPTQAIGEVIVDARDTTSVAILSYQFFTGKIPTAAGMDYLVSPTGPNANNLNSAYYQSFNLENRYINFAVNLGAVGEARSSFESQYGGKSLFDATKAAYATLFGGAPTDDKVHALIDTRADYFAAYGLDGPSGTGTKAAMVGWLLAEAVKADVGVYAKANDAFLMDLAHGTASYAVDIVGAYAGTAHYG